MRDDKIRGALIRLGLVALLMLTMLGSPFARGARSPAVASAAAHPPGYLSDLRAATYDQATGDLILVGEHNPDLPPLDKNNLTVALRTRFDFVANPRDFWPGVTIEFSPTNQNVLDVIYFGNVRDTRFGYVLFESDRLLKYYGLGYDNSSGVAVPISSTVPGYQSELACLAEQGFTPPSGQTIQWRKWFSPSLTIEATADDTAITFAEAGMALNWAYDSQATSPAVDLCVKRFVDHFNVHYQEFADEQQALGNPVLHELVQLAKLTAIAEWLRDRELDSRIPGLNRPWLNGIAVPFHETPSTTPRIDVTAGSIIQSGGVDMSFPPESFKPDTGTAQQLGEAARESRPSGQEDWDFPCALAHTAPALPEPPACPMSATATPIATNPPVTQEINGTVITYQEALRKQKAYAIFVASMLRLHAHADQRTRLTLYYWLARTTQQTSMHPEELRLLPQGRTVPVRRAATPSLAAEDVILVRLIPEQGPPILLDTFSGAGMEGYWLPQAGFDLSAYRNQRFSIQFETQIAPGSETVFMVGAIALNTDPAPFADPPTPTPTFTPTLTPTLMPTLTPILTPVPALDRRIYLPLIMR